jgi:hypothetical protein
MRRALGWPFGVVFCIGLLLCPAAEAGMPSPLPTPWTADNPKAYSHLSHRVPMPSTNAVDARVQAVSFFVACLLASAWGVQRLWNALGRDFQRLPQIGYGRALSFVCLWGCLFIIVLTMISGARELMTPGAWRKQGWTYQLAAAPPSDNGEPRREALDRLRIALWQSARDHDGQFPARDDLTVESDLWKIPGGLGLKFSYVPNRQLESAGRLLVYEPEGNGPERFVLLTNGVIGTMTTGEIEKLLAEKPPL